MEQSPEGHLDPQHLPAWLQPGARVAVGFMGSTDLYFPVAMPAGPDGPDREAGSEDQHISPTGTHKSVRPPVAPAPTPAPVDYNPPLVVEDDRSYIQVAAETFNLDASPVVVDVEETPDGELVPINQLPNLKLGARDMLLNVLSAQGIEPPGIALIPYGDHETRFRSPETAQTVLEVLGMWQKLEVLDEQGLTELLGLEEYEIKANAKEAKDHFDVERAESTVRRTGMSKLRRRREPPMIQSLKRLRKATVLQSRPDLTEDDVPLEEFQTQVVQSILSALDPETAIQGQARGVLSKRVVEVAFNSMLPHKILAEGPKSRIIETSYRQDLGDPAARLLVLNAVARGVFYRVRSAKLSKDEVGRLHAAISSLKEVMPLTPDGRPK
jgi:hypothetical protein